MARRTTVVLTSEDRLALRRAAEALGVSQAEIIRRGIRAVTAPYRRRVRPRAGWLKLTQEQRAQIAADDFRGFGAE